MTCKLVPHAHSIKQNISNISFQLKTTTTTPKTAVGNMAGSCGAGGRNSNGVRFTEEKKLTLEKLGTCIFTFHPKTHLPIPFQPNRE